MDLILNETKDPVSGNVAPLGATPEEERDDVPINASPNEFMINAATRRYYGTDFFEELQSHMYYNFTQKSVKNYFQKNLISRQNL